MSEHINTPESVTPEVMDAMVASMEDIAARRAALFDRSSVQGDSLVADSAAEIGIPLDSFSPEQIGLLSDCEADLEGMYLEENEEGGDDE